MRVDGQKKMEFVDSFKAAQSATRNAYTPGFILKSSTCPTRRRTMRNAEFKKTFLGSSNFFRENLCYVTRTLKEYTHTNTHTHAHPAHAMTKTKKKNNEEQVEKEKKTRKK